MNLKMLKAAFAGLVLSVSGFANAGLITVDFEMNGTVGEFSGTDINVDGFLKFDELESFFFDGQIASLIELDDFGDFQISPELWINNAISWVGHPTDTAYITWDSRNLSANETNVSSLTYSVRVPEPSILAIFALGIMGLASRRFKKQS